MEAITKHFFPAGGDDGIATTIAGWKTSPDSYTGNATLDTTVIKLFVAGFVLLVHLILVHRNKPRFFIGAVLTWTVRARTDE